MDAYNPYIRLPEAAPNAPEKMRFSLDAYLGRPAVAGERIIILLGNAASSGAWSYRALAAGL